MKYQVIAALLGAASSVQLREEMKERTQVSEEMRRKCADVMNIQAPEDETNLMLSQDDEPAATPMPTLDTATDGAVGSAAPTTSPATEWKDIDPKNAGLQK